MLLVPLHISQIATAVIEEGCSGACSFFEHPKDALDWVLLNSFGDGAACVRCLASSSTCQDVQCCCQQALCTLQEGQLRMGAMISIVSIEHDIKHC